MQTKLPEISKELYYELANKIVRDKLSKEVDLKIVNILVEILYIIHQFANKGIEEFYEKMNLMFNINFNMDLVFDLTNTCDVYKALRYLVDINMVKYKGIWNYSVDTRRFDWLKASEKKLYRKMLKLYEEEQSEA